MKYIRTKDGRILIAPNLYDNGGVVLCSDPPMYETRNAKNEWDCVFCHDVIKQANTIEELCDELIIKNPNKDGEFYRKVFVYQGAWENILNEKHAKFCTNRDIYEHDVEIFGAIWTDKGLIYVAKMNDKGELELL